MEHRKDWGNEKMPFYFTQIAPYKHGGQNRTEAAYMMWAQAQTIAMIPYSGMATTLDVGKMGLGPIHTLRENCVCLT